MIVADRNRKNPSDLVFWNDLRAALVRCSPNAKALWTVHMLPCAAESVERGVVIVGNHPSRKDDLGGLLCFEFGLTSEVTQEAVDELVSKGVASVDGAGRIYNRRMVDDEAERLNKVRAGGAGGKVTQEKRRAKQTSSRGGSRDPSSEGSTPPSSDGAPEKPPSDGKQTTIPEGDEKLDKQTASTSESSIEASSILPSSSFGASYKNGENLTDRSIVPCGTGDDAQPGFELVAQNGHVRPSPERQAFDAWNEAAKRQQPRWKIARDFSDVRCKALTARLKQIGGLENWLAMLEHAERQRFIRETMRAWSFDWLLSPKNLTKVIEGNYDDDRDRPGSRDAPKRSQAEILHGLKDRFRRRREAGNG